MEMFFLFIGLGFFLLCIKIVLSSEKEEYQRRVNEMREFGFRFDQKERTKKQP